MHLLSRQPPKSYIIFRKLVLWYYFLVFRLCIQQILNNRSCSKCSYSYSSKYNLSLSNSTDKILFLPIYFIFSKIFFIVFFNFFIFYLGLIFFHISLFLKFLNPLYFCCFEFVVQHFFWKIWIGFFIIFELLEHLILLQFH